MPCFTYIEDSQHPNGPTQHGTSSPLPQGDALPPASDASAPKTTMPQGAAQPSPGGSGEEPAPIVPPAPAPPSVPTPPPVVVPPVDPSGSRGNGSQTGPYGGQSGGFSNGVGSGQSSGGGFQPPSLNPMPPQDEAFMQAFRSIRGFVTASQVTALVSLIVGGVVLSTVSIVLALVARSKAVKLLRNPGSSSPETWYMLRRSATIAAVMGGVAFGLNAVMLAVTLPAVLEMLQSGDYSSVWGSGGAGGSVGSSPNSGSSVWG